MIGLSDLRRTSEQLLASSSELNLYQKVSHYEPSRTLCPVVEPWRIASSIEQKVCVSTYIVAGEVVDVGLGKHGVAGEVVRHCLCD